MDAKMMKKLAEQFDALAETLTAIGGTFRSASGSGEDAGGDAPAGKSVRKPRTSAAKSKPAAAEITEDTLREKLKELAASKGKEKMADALAEVGAGRLPEVGEDDYDALDKAIDALMEAEDEPAPKGKGKPAAKKGKAKAPDYDEVEAKFKELLEADKAAAREVLKEAGLKRLSEVDQDDDGALQDLLNAITEALDGEDMV